MSSIKSTLIAACLAFVIGGTSTDAQNVFAPVARVNESVITEFEVLFAPLIENSCQEEDSFIVLERILEDVLMDFLSGLSNLVANL